MNNRFIFKRTDKFHKTIHQKGGAPKIYSFGTPSKMNFHVYFPMNEIVLQSIINSFPYFIECIRLKRIP